MVSPDDSQPVSTSAPEPALGSVGDTSRQLAGTPVVVPTPGFETREWALTLAFSLTAGLMAWACAEMMLVPEIATGKRGGAARLLPEVPASRNAMVSFGMLGGALGLSLGLAGGLIRRSVLWTALAAAIGLVLGGVTGIGVTWLTLPVYYVHLQSNDMIYSLLVHGGTWTAIGAMGGLAFGLGRGGWGRITRCVLGAAAAALLATVI